jgi:uncharacterized membrane protein required for colicin V production
MGTVWPNWVDLLIVTIVLRASYIGFSRGILSELLDTVTLVGITALTVNYGEAIGRGLQGQFALNPVVMTCIVFWGFFLSLILIARAIFRRLTAILGKWEPIHWMLRWVGMLIGAGRGLWWAGFLLIALTTSGFTYLQESVEVRSLLGSRMIGIARHTLERVADYVPGATQRSEQLMPPVRAATE